MTARFSSSVTRSLPFSCPPFSERAESRKSSSLISLADDMGKGHRFLDEIVLGDLAFEATADSVSELFVTAAMALIEAMVDPRTVGTNWTRNFRLSESEIEDLFFEWLNTIVFVKDAEGVVFHDVRATVRHDLENKGWHLDATLTGDRVDATRQDLRTDVKAVTKHLYEIRPNESGWYARVVIDV